MLVFLIFGVYDDSVMMFWFVIVWDKLLVSELNYLVINYLLVYVGDILFIVINYCDVVDLILIEGLIWCVVVLMFEVLIYN